MSQKEILLQDAPNFSKYLTETFEGNIEVTEIKEVKQGFSSQRSNILSLIMGKDTYRRRIDEDVFYDLQHEYPSVKDFFIGPFYKCQRTKITFRRPETAELLTHRKMLEEEEPLESVESIMEHILTRNKGELRVYIGERDEEGRMPITYNGFKPGVGYHNISGIDYIRLVYGTFKKLRKLVDYFDAPINSEKRGSVLNNNKWMRYDGHDYIPFP